MKGAGYKGETHKAAGKTLRNYPPVFFQAPKTYKGWTRGTSPTRCTPRGGGKRGMSTREKPDKLIEKARRLEEETPPRKQPFNLNSIICQPPPPYHRSKILCNTDGWNDIRDWNWFALPRIRKRMTIVLIRTKFRAISKDCACLQTRLMLKLFIQYLRDYFAIVIDGHSFTFI